MFFDTKDERNDGGSAFPLLDPRPRSVLTNEPTQHTAEPQPGMSLRDYFAAKALGGMIAATSDNAVREMMLNNATEGERTLKQQVAFSAYEYADAMLAERAA